VRGFTGEGAHTGGAWWGAEKRGYRPGELLGASLRLATTGEGRWRGCGDTGEGRLGTYQRRMEAAAKKSSSMGWKRCERK